MSIFRAVFNFFYEILFGCAHERLTRPFTLEAQTYKVCLDCGTQIYYSPVTLRPLSTREVRRMKAVQSSEVKVMPTAPSAPILVPAGRRKTTAA